MVINYIKLSLLAQVAGRWRARIQLSGLEGVVWMCGHLRAFYGSSVPVWTLGHPCEAVLGP